MAVDPIVWVGLRRHDKRIFAVSLLFDGVYSTWGLHLSVLLEFWSKYSPVRSYTDRMDVQDINIHVVAMPKWYTVKLINEQYKHQTTLYRPPTGARDSLSAAAIVPSLSSCISSRIAFVTVSSVSPSTRIYSFGFSPGCGSLPAG